MINEDTPAWFLLFDGESEDGRGSASYIGRTLSVKLAYAHTLQCKANPYSTGYTVIITNNQYIHADNETDWRRYE